MGDVGDVGDVREGWSLGRIVVVVCRHALLCSREWSGVEWREVSKAGAEAADVDGGGCGYEPTEPTLDSSQRSKRENVNRADEGRWSGRAASQPASHQPGSKQASKHCITPLQTAARGVFLFNSIRVAKSKKGQVWKK